MKTWLRPIAALGAIATLASCGLAGNSSELSSYRAGALGAKSVSGQTPRVQARLHFKSLAQLDRLENNGVDLFENVDVKSGTVDALVTPEGQAHLKKVGLPFEIRVATFNERATFPKGYQTVDGVEKDMQALAVQYPSIVRLQTIGKSLEGRAIYAVNLTSKPGAKLPAIRIMSGQHARELPPVEVNSRLMHLLAEGYGKDANITRLVDTRDIWLIPIVNPDGRNKVQEGSSMWRKNVRDNGDGSHGVDTNRNGDDHFELGVNDGDSDSFRGKAPFSEPESQAIRDLCAKVKFAVSMDIHCYAGMILWPPGFTTESSKDEAAFKAIGERMAKPINYRAGTIARTIYKTYGDLATWEYNTHGTLAFACELADPGFNPGYSQVDTDWKQWKDNLLYLIDVAGNPRAAAR